MNVTRRPLFYGRLLPGQSFQHLLFGSKQGSKYAKNHATVDTIGATTGCKIWNVLCVCVWHLRTKFLLVFPVIFRNKTGSCNFTKGTRPSPWPWSESMESKMLKMGSQSWWRNHPPRVETNNLKNQTSQTLTKTLDPTQMVQSNLSQVSWLQKMNHFLLHQKKAWTA